MQITKGLANILILVIFIIAIFAGAASYFIFIKKRAVQPTPSPKLTPAQQMPKISSPTPRDETTDWQKYTNNDLGYSIKYPTSWQVDESGQQNSLNKEVIINPVSAEPFVSYISILVDLRKLDLIREVHKNSQEPTFIEKEITFGGKSAFEYTIANSDLAEIYIEHKGQIFLVSTGKFSLREVQQSLSSFRFTR